MSALLLGLLVSISGAHASLHRVGKASSHSHVRSGFDEALSNGFIVHRQELQTGACPVFEGFEFKAQQDVPEGVAITCKRLGNLTVADIWDECTQVGECRSFNLWQTRSGTPAYCLNGASQTFTDQSTTYMPLACQGVYVQVNCLAAPDGYTFYKSTVPTEAWEVGLVACSRAEGQDMSALVTACKQAQPQCQTFSLFSSEDGTGDQVYCGTTAGPLTVPLNAIPAGKCYGSYVPSTPSIPWLQQWGGQIMADTVNVYMIYVGGYAPTDKVPTTLNHFVDNLEDSDWWRVVTRFWMGSKDSPSYANGALALAGSYFIPSTSAMNLIGSEISDDVFTSIKYLIDNGQVPWDPKQGLYVVVPKAGQYKALPPCQDIDYCGWHHYGSAHTNNTEWSQLKFALVPDSGCAVGCAPSNDPTGAGSFVSTTYTNLTSPTGSDYVDGLVSILAHELVEAVTDPFGDAWTTVEGPEGENGDVCRSNALSPSTYTAITGSKVFYNALVGDKPYLVQLTYDPSLIPESNGTQQYGCVYGVNRAGATMTVDQGLPALFEASVPASPPRSVSPPSGQPTPATTPPSLQPTPAAMPPTGQPTPAAMPPAAQPTSAAMPPTAQPTPAAMPPTAQPTPVSMAPPVQLSPGSMPTSLQPNPAPMPPPVQLSPATMPPLAIAMSPPPSSTSSATAMPNPSRLLWAMASIAAAVCVILS